VPPHCPLKCLLAGRANSRPSPRHRGSNSFNKLSSDVVSFPLPSFHTSLFFASFPDQRGSHSSVCLIATFSLSPPPSPSDLDEPGLAPLHVRSFQFFSRMSRRNWSLSLGSLWTCMLATERRGTSPFGQINKPAPPLCVLPLADPRFVHYQVFDTCLGRIAT